MDEQMARPQHSVLESHRSVGADDRRVLSDIILVGGIGQRWRAPATECDAVLGMTPDPSFFLTIYVRCLGWGLGSAER